MNIQMHNGAVESRGTRVLARLRAVTLKPLGTSVQANPATGVLTGDDTVDAINRYRRPRIE